MLIGILGRKRVGKDTVADYLCEKYGFRKLTLAQPLKDICKVAYDFSDEQLYGSLKEVIDDRIGVSPRIVYQYIGTEVFRKDINRIIPDIKNNFWINLIAENYLEIKRNSDNDLVVISDVRFQNEIDKIHELGGIVIKINRDIDLDGEKSLMVETKDYDLSKLKFGESLNDVCKILFNFTDNDEIDSRFGVKPFVIYNYLETEIFKVVSLTTSNMHESEKDIDFLSGDYEIVNDKKKEDLYKNIDNIINVFKHNFFK